MRDTSVNTTKWINAHSNELDSIRFQFASNLVCSVNEPLNNNLTCYFSTLKLL